MSINQEQEAPSIPDTILFVAYGTLRKGESLHDWIADSIVNDLGPVVIKGAKLYFSEGHNYYPVLVWSGSIADKAVGELYELDLNNNTLAMLRMEINAGYTLNEASVETPNGELLEATVCAWKYEHGKEVPNNDWCSVETKEWWK